MGDYKEKVKETSTDCIMIENVSNTIDLYIKYLSNEVNNDKDNVGGNTDIQYNKNTFRDIVGEYKEMKQNKNTLTDEYLLKIKSWIDNMSNIYNAKQSKYIKDNDYKQENDIKFFGEMYMILSNFMFNLQFISATFSEFNKELESKARIKYDKITLNLMKQLNLWQIIYPSHLDTVINKIAGEWVFTADSKLFAKKSLHNLSNNATEFITACYKGDYLTFVSDFAHHAKEYMSQGDDKFNPCHVIEDIIIEFVETLNDPKNFMKILFKSIEKNKKHQTQLQNELGWIDSPGIEVYPKILAIIIIDLLKLDCKNAELMDDNDKRKLLEQCENVITKCDQLKIDQQTKSLIKRYFMSILNGDMEYDNVCQVNCSSDGCVIL